MDFLKKIFLIDFFRSKIDKHKEKKAKSEKMIRDYEKEQDMRGVLSIFLEKGGLA